MVGRIYKPRDIDSPGCHDGPVLALELLAAQVAAAEAARRDWETAHRMAANNDNISTW